MINRKLNGPWRITFDTNPNDCNILCIMCERNNKQKRENYKTMAKEQMPSTIISEAVRNALEMGELKEIIPSTMGEPLLYENFKIFIDLCIENDLKMNLTTNGTFPNREISDWTQVLLPICSDIKISWNGFTKTTDEKIMQGRNYEKAKSNLLKLLEERRRIKETIPDTSNITLQLTFMEINYREIPDIVEMAYEIGIDRVKGHHLWIHNEEAKEWSMRRSEESVKKWNDLVHEVFERNEICKEKYDHNVKLENFHEIKYTDTELLADSICPFLGREAWVSANGQFNPCCAPDELRKQLGNFGNLNEKSLREIWESKEYNDLCKNYNENELCKICNMKKKPEDVYKYES